MKFTYTCKKVSLNDSVKAYAEKKVGKLEKFFKEEPEASVTFSVEKKNRCVAEIMLRGAPRAAGQAAFAACGTLKGPPPHSAAHRRAHDGRHGVGDDHRRRCHRQ